MSKEESSGSFAIPAPIAFVLSVPTKIVNFFATLIIQSISFVYGIGLLIGNSVLSILDYNPGSSSSSTFSKIKDLIFVTAIYAFAYQVGLFFTPIPLAIVIVTKYILRYKVKQLPLPPAILSDPAYGKHFYTTIRNVRLHYVSKGDTSKPLMLFLHGFPDFWFSWREQLKHYSEHYWTVAVDMRGYGDSEKLAGISSYDIDELVEDVKNLIQSLQRENAIIVAHDWGGIVLYILLLKYPELVHKYVALNIAPPYAMKFNPRQIVKSWYLFFFQMPIIPELLWQTANLIAFDRLYKKHGDEVVKAYKFTFSKSGAFTPPLNYYRANLASLTKYSITGASIVKSKKLPSGLAIYSKNDNYVDYKSFDDRTESWGLKNHLLVGEDHFVHQNNPELVNKLIDDFLGIETSD